MAREVKEAHFERKGGEGFGHEWPYNPLCSQSDEYIHFFGAQEAEKSRSVSQTVRVKGFPLQVSTSCLLLMSDGDDGLLTQCILCYSTACPLLYFVSLHIFLWYKTCSLYWHSFLVVSSLSLLLIFPEAQDPVESKVNCLPKCFHPHTLPLIFL